MINLKIKVNSYSVRLLDFTDFNCTAVFISYVAKIYLLKWIRRTTRTFVGPVAQSV